jgi:hypothetical protein
MEYWASHSSEMTLRIKNVKENYYYLLINSLPALRTVG